MFIIQNLTDISIFVKNDLDIIVESQFLLISIKLLIFFDILKAKVVKSDRAGKFSVNIRVTKMKNY